MLLDQNCYHQSKSIKVNLRKTAGNDDTAKSGLAQDRNPKVEAHVSLSPYAIASPDLPRSSAVSSTVSHSFRSKSPSLISSGRWILLLLKVC